MEEGAFSPILDAIYDATTMPERWPVILERLRPAFACSYVGVISRNLRTMRGHGTAVGIDLAGQREFFETWSAHDVLRLRTQAYWPGAVETDQDILPRSELLSSDYYNGFLKRYDMHAYMRMTLASENEFRQIISLSRPVSGGDFEASDVAQGRRLIPHLQRAARVAQHVEESQLMLNAFSDVLDRGSRGVLLLDGSGRILFANRAARAMAQAEDGFRLRGDHIESDHIGDQAMLQRLLAGATGRLDRADAVRGGVMRLSRKSGKPAYVLVAAPLATDTTLTEMGPVAFALITDPEASTPSTAVIRELFRLSAAEMRVAERLMMGDSPEQAATSLGIRTSTARWHLAALYRKTDTKRQAELVRLLLTLPSV